ncbi:unnamed protein product, partial [Rotaria sordida]
MHFLVIFLFVVLSCFNIKALRQEVHPGHCPKPIMTCAIICLPMFLNSLLARPIGGCISN